MSTLWCAVLFFVGNVYVISIMHFMSIESPFNLLASGEVETHYIPWILLVTVQLLHIISLVLYAVLQLKDPGTIPRRTNIKSTEKWRPINPLLSCKECMIEDVPVGARHCRKCNHCVRQFDHHCWMLGRCIGFNNYHLFLALVTMELLVISFACYWIVVNGRVWHQVDISYWDDGIELVVLSATLLGLIYFWAWLAFLFMLHLYLIKKGIRTHQFWSSHQKHR